jgi:hypothetical protein
LERQELIIESQVIDSLLIQDFQFWLKILLDLIIKGILKSKKPAECDFCGLLQILGVNYADRTGPEPRCFSLNTTLHIIRLKFNTVKDYNRK